MLSGNSGLLHHWQNAGENRHWLLPLKKNVQYEVIHKLGRQDSLVRIRTTPQAKKQWAGLPEEITARLVTGNGAAGAVGRAADL